MKTEARVFTTICAGQTPIQKVSLKGMLGPNQSRDGSSRTKHSADISKKEKLR